MDESWRKRIGMLTTPPPMRTVAQPRFPNYRSAEDNTSFNIPKTASGEHPLNPEDFTDVFGGPPRTVLSGQFSTGFPTSNFFYEEIFRHPENVPSSTGRIGRSLKEFMIPTKSFEDQHNRQKSGFYTDIFDERVMRSRSRSKTSSSSILSSEELSPIRRAVCPDDSVSSFVAKLRPINVKSSWSPTRMRQNDYRKQQNMTPSTGTQPVFNPEYEYTEDFKKYLFGLSRRNATPETISVEPISNSSFRVSTDCLEPNSPASAVSSVCHSDMEQKTRAVEEDMPMQDEVELDEDEVMSSYVIEINSENREGTSESNGVDEAIAWAKEKFHKHCLESKWGSENSEKGKQLEENFGMNQFTGHTDSFGSLDEQQDNWALEEEIQPSESKLQTEMQAMDENIRLWSKGKESDIRLLLSSLHHILWPNSGWFPVPLTNIIESSKVKKAYQKARLCLHPDKLQQRGATLPQKYIAEKAFPILQDAWASICLPRHLPIHKIKASQMHAADHNNNYHELNEEYCNSVCCFNDYLKRRRLMQGF
ncbi:hypothetical protein F511_01827 [Dorcoceras hygrometricum]|uniref:J domain-containing protein required for chloroplast accumulation response 1-like n=1 Tax=Dorcoceras hygrometricum TaxID=472368 RepID=A0A2Z7CXG9_9LAMI|nr:hypothetical protein F511_01827 [Dorcoceras hygrometricum]